MLAAWVRRIILISICSEPFHFNFVGFLIQWYQLTIWRATIEWFVLSSFDPKKDAQQWSVKNISIIHKFAFPLNVFGWLECFWENSMGCYGSKIITLYSAGYSGIANESTESYSLKQWIAKSLLNLELPPQVYQLAGIIFLHFCSRCGTFW